MLAAERSRVAALAIHSDQTRSNGAQHVDSHIASYKITHAALPGLDRARETTQTQLNTLRKKTAGPVADTGVSGLMLAGELRNLLASMKPDDRMKAIITSINEGDDSLASAALSASRYLSGLTELEQIVYVWNGRIRDFLIK